MKLILKLILILIKYKENVNKMKYWDSHEKMKKHKLQHLKYIFAVIK